MKAASSHTPDYAARIKRSELLATKYPFAAEVLRFYGQVAAVQRDLYDQLPLKWGTQPLARLDGPLRSELNLVVLLPHFRKWLDFVARSGPSGLAQAARQLAARNSNHWIALFSDFWVFAGLPVSDKTVPHNAEPLEHFLLLAFLHPYCEFLAAHAPAPVLETTHRVCPRCGSLPLLGVLRPEGDGAKRHLLCSFCLHEWDFRRIYCAACGEEDEKRLPVYVAEQFPHIRAECCDTCRFYLRTIDLTTDGNAVPIVDDLAAIPLSLWAQEHGYSRIHNNLFAA